jgi:hypothetical protein
MSCQYDDKELEFPGFSISDYGYGFLSCLADHPALQPQQPPNDVARLREHL